MLYLLTDSEDVRKSGNKVSAPSYFHTLRHSDRSVSLPHIIYQCYVVTDHVTIYTADHIAVCRHVRRRDAQKKYDRI